MIKASLAPLQALIVLACHAHHVHTLPTCIWCTPSSPIPHHPQVWSVATQRFAHSLVGHSHWVRSCGYSPHSPNMVVSGGDDRTVRVWDVRTRSCVYRMEDVEGAPLAVAAHPHEHYIASGGVRCGVVCTAVVVLHLLLYYATHNMCVVDTTSVHINTQSTITVPVPAPTHRHRQSGQTMGHEKSTPDSILPSTHPTSLLTSFSPNRAPAAFLW